VADVLPKLIAHRLKVAVNELDVVLSDVPMGTTVKVHAFNHLPGVLCKLLREAETGEPLSSRVSTFFASSSLPAAHQAHGHST